MNTNEVIGTVLAVGIPLIVGLIGMITPIIKLNTTITELNVTIKQLTKDNESIQEVIKGHTETLGEHETRLSLLEVAKH